MLKQWKRSRTAHTFHSNHAERVMPTIALTLTSVPSAAIIGLSANWILLLHATPTDFVDFVMLRSERAYALGISALHIGWKESLRVYACRSVCLLSCHCLASQEFRGQMHARPCSPLPAKVTFLTFVPLQLHTLCKQYTAISYFCALNAVLHSTRTIRHACCLMLGLSDCSALVLYQSMHIT